jgi:DtxR family Mn-dependent transcriptional regulator
MVARWRSSRERSTRSLLEDALKHLYDCEYRNIPCTLESLAGTLSISGEAAAKLILRLEAMRLATRTERDLRLTAEGRSYALRMIRVHRLWERYLADETNVAERDWHTEAEREEHKISAEQADELARRLGNPLYDPHGDPIPSAAGNLPQQQGIPLTALDRGVLARIVHLEDEPESLYAQLVAVGLGPGIQIRLIDRTPDRIIFEANGEEIVLAPVVAANVSVVPLAAEKWSEVSHETLADLNVGEQGVVLGLSPLCRGLQRRRLMDLGIVPGTTIEAEMRSPFGDPTSYKIRGTSIALRKEQAEMIYVSREKKAA